MNETITEAQKLLAEQMKQVFASISYDLTQHHTIPELAQHFGISEPKLKVGFKLVYGRGIFETLTVLRMSHAIELLHNNVLVKDVAKRVGYNQSTNFVAAFRRHYDITPGKYIKSIS